MVLLIYLVWNLMPVPHQMLHAQPPAMHHLPLKELEHYYFLPVTVRTVRTKRLNYFLKVNLQMKIRIQILLEDLTFCALLLVASPFMVSEAASGLMSA